MRFYSNENITEGAVYPNAWIWHGSIISLSNNAPKGWVLRIKLPWWIRRYSGWHDRDMLHQLIFSVIHFVGSPERYDILFHPVEAA